MLSYCSRLQWLLRATPLRSRRWQWLYTHRRWMSDREQLIERRLHKKVRRWQRRYLRKPAHECRKQWRYALWKWGCFGCYWAKIRRLCLLHSRQPLNMNPRRLHRSREPLTPSLQPLPRHQKRTSQRRLLLNLRLRRWRSLRLHLPDDPKTPCHVWLPTLPDRPPLSLKISLREGAMCPPEGHHFPPMRSDQLPLNLHPKRAQMCQSRLSSCRMRLKTRPKPMTLPLPLPRSRQPPLTINCLPLLPRRWRLKTPRLRLLYDQGRWQIEPSLVRFDQPPLIHSPPMRSDQEPLIQSPPMPSDPERWNCDRLPLLYGPKRWNFLRSRLLHNQTPQNGLRLQWLLRNRRLIGALLRLRLHNRRRLQNRQGCIFRF